MYAWKITTDHAASEYGDDTGVFGPRSAPAELLAKLDSGAGHTFRMYDDDGELVYTGKLVTDGEMTEEVCYAPLGDFGMPNFGCTYIRWHGRPHWDCG